MGFKEMQQLFPIARRKNKLSYHKSIESSGENKPEISQYYKSTKEGVGTMDHVVRYSCIERMTRRRPMFFFYQNDKLTQWVSYLYEWNFKLPCKARMVAAMLCLLHKQNTCKNYSRVSPVSSETFFIPFVSCLRKYEQEKEMLPVPFEKRKGLLRRVSTELLCWAQRQYLHSVQETSAIVMFTYFFWIGCVNIFQFFFYFACISFEHC